MTHPDEARHGVRDAGDARDAARWRALVAVMEGAAGGGYLTFNADAANFERAPVGDRAVLRVYPDTPVGFSVFVGASLADVVDAYAASDVEPGPGVDESLPLAPSRAERDAA